MAPDSHAGADEALLVEPIEGPLDATVVLPGSKSITNRALVCAALAEGESRLLGPLEADDTMAMVEGLRALGVSVERERASRTDRSPDGAIWLVTGCAGRPPSEVAIVDARLSGTTSRFLMPVAGLGVGVTRVDGALQLRARPMGPSIHALRELGVKVVEAGAPGHLPLDLSEGPAAGGAVDVAGDASSQFLSGLLLAGPAMRTGVTLRVEGPLVSAPYVEMTAAVMAAFGVEVSRSDATTWSVAPQTYRGTRYRIEPDASAASYAFAAAAIVGGRVRVEGLSPASLQGDVAFVDLLERMGAEVERTGTGITVTGTGGLRGIEADLGQISDTAQTLAAVATFAEGPTRVTGIGFIRHKETDRVGNVVTELRRAGIRADEEADGFVVHPGPAQPATVETYHDHRMAMSFALLGLRRPGIRISDPGCVGKTFPGFWTMLQGLRDRTGSTGRVLPS